MDIFSDWYETMDIFSGIFLSADLRRWTFIPIAMDIYSAKPPFPHKPATIACFHVATMPVERSLLMLRYDDTRQNWLDRIAWSMLISVMNYITISGEFEKLPDQDLYRNAAANFFGVLMQGGILNLEVRIVANTKEQSFSTLLSMAPQPPGLEIES